MTKQNLSCAQISRAITKIKADKATFDRLFDDETIDFKDKVSHLFELKITLEKNIDFLENQIIPAKIFISKLAEEETWQQITSCYKEEIESGVWEDHHANPNLFNSLEKIFDDLPVAMEVNSQEEYENFVQRLKSLSNKLTKPLSNLRKNIQEFFEKQEDIDQSDIDTYCHTKSIPFLVSALHSIFLNKYLAPNTEINLEKVPYIDFFGCYLKRGIFNAKEAGDYAGLHLDGATLNIERVENHYGELAQSGVLRAKLTGYETGSMMGGGTLRVLQSGHSFAEYLSGVVIADRVENVFDKLPVTRDSFIDSLDGLILVDSEIDPRVINLNEPDVIVYAQQRKKYRPTSSGEYITTTEEEYRNFLQTEKQKKKLVVVDFESDKNLSQGLDGGIVVFRKAPRENIGLEMSGGAIILEDPSLTVEEASKRISKDRTGGIILMRVPDPSNPGKTKLIDLEMPDDWNN